MNFSSGAADVLPPHGNTGVENTYKNKCSEKARPEKVFLLDWLQFTVKDLHTIDDAILFLDLDRDRLRKSQYSVNKMYETMYTIDNKIKIFLDGRNKDFNVGVHFEMSGQACRYYETVSNGDLIDLIAKIMSFDSKIARCDLAVDLISRKDEKPYFTLSDLEQKLEKNHVRMKFRRSSVVKSFGHSSTIDMDAIDLGRTIYLGSKKSDLMIRFYDKLKERLVNGIGVDEDITSWIRCEIMLRDQHATKAIPQLLNYEGAKVVTGILSDKLNFTEPNTDKNKSRWEISDWWLEFLDDVKKIKLTKGQKPVSVERTENWIDHQVKKSLAFLALAYDGDMSKLHAMIAEAKKDLTDEQIILAEEYAEMHYKRLDRQNEENIKDYNEYRRKKAIEAYYNQHL